MTPDRAPTIHELLAFYLEAGVDLFAQAAEGALAEAGLTGAQVDVIVTVSSTGIATPSLEARAMNRLGFRRDAARVPVFGLGCAGGSTGLALAARLARAEPGAVVLFVCVELCSLAFRIDEPSKADIVATALFGDGAAGAILSTEGDGPSLIAAGEHTWPDSLDVMGWDVQEDGLKARFAQSIPSLGGSDGCPGFAPQPPTSDTMARAERPRTKVARTGR